MRKIKRFIQNVENIMHGTAFKIPVKHIWHKQNCLQKIELYFILGYSMHIHAYIHLQLRE